ncbi:peptidoglycan editing factor PgeF [Thiomonas intermedia]|uniref:peptidoglycan editing factor PgeF n=1 Tax=Thiomonas intermedia TaxID=926 RepID=UPI0009A497F6|nr:peptidoglycan editing factor PgeF [Thiomonas intermedia]
MSQTPILKDFMPESLSAVRALDPAFDQAPWLQVVWPGNPRVRAVFTSRVGGVSAGDYGGAAAAPGLGMNLGTHVADAPSAVAQNRLLLRKALRGAEPLYLQQVHGVAVADLDLSDGHSPEPVADAACTTRAHIAATVLVADCLPVLFAAPQGRAVAAAHAGWRGLAGGVLEAALESVCTRAGCDAAEVQVALGPAIGPAAFEVGDEVRAAFVSWHPQTSGAFTPGRPGKWWADLWALARIRLQTAGVLAEHVAGGGLCTLGLAQRFYSYRRQPITGRQAGCIWVE